MKMEINPRNMLFVYGTLKRNCGNHPTMEASKAEFVCEATTAIEYPLQVRGLPNLYDKPGKGRIVKGELYACPFPHTLARLDRFEGHPNLYKRGPIEVRDPAGNALTVWTYFRQGKPAPNLVNQEEYQPVEWTR